jgi:hypothetical protein
MGMTSAMMEAQTTAGTGRCASPHVLRADCPLTPITHCLEGKNFKSPTVNIYQFDAHGC